MAVVGGRPLTTANELAGQRELCTPKSERQIKLLAGPIIGQLGNSRFGLFAVQSLIPAPASVQLS